MGKRMGKAIASALGLIAGLIWFRHGRVRSTLIVATAAFVMAAAIALLIHLARGQ